MNGSIFLMAPEYRTKNSDIFEIKTVRFSDGLNNHDLTILKPNGLIFELHLNTLSFARP